MEEVVAYSSKWTYRDGKTSEEVAVLTAPAGTRAKVESRDRGAPSFFDGLECDQARGDRALTAVLPILADLQADGLLANCEHSLEDSLASKDFSTETARKMARWLRSTWGTVQAGLTVLELVYHTGMSTDKVTLLSQVEPGEVIAWTPPYQVSGYVFSKN